MGVPLMLYFPAPCVENRWNAGGKYKWADTAAESGFVIPVPEQSAEFWGDIFDYGASLASHSVDPAAETWPGVWAPPAVVAGWKGTNLAAYETDFYHNIVLATPVMRQVIGAGEMFLDGINTACAERNMTAQLCAGNPPSFLEALTMPSITNARASIGMRLCACASACLCEHLRACALILPCVSVRECLCLHACMYICM